MLGDIVRLIVAIVASSFLLALLVACLSTRTARSRVKACTAGILIMASTFFTAWRADLPRHRYRYRYSWAMVNYGPWTNRRQGLNA